MSRVLQESFAEFIVEELTPGGFNYDSKHTTWDADVDGKIIHTTGFFAVQLNDLKQVITGKESYNYMVDSSNRNQVANISMAQMETAVVDPSYIRRDSAGKITVDPAGIEALTGGVTIMSRLSAGGQHSNHFMRAYKIELGGETYILARNTIEGQENIIMTVKEYENSIMHAILDKNIQGLASSDSIETVLSQVAAATSVEDFVSIDGVPTYAASRTITPEQAALGLKVVAPRKITKETYPFEEVSNALGVLREDKNISMQGVVDYGLNIDDIIRLHQIIEEQRQRSDGAAVSKFDKFTRQAAKATEPESLNASILFGKPSNN